MRKRERVESVTSLCVFLLLCDCQCFMSIPPFSIFRKVVFFNPFMPNVFSHPYQMGESISNLRVVGWDFSFLFKF